MHMKLKGTFIDPQTLTDKLLRDKDFYDESMGGVTFQVENQPYSQIL